MKGREIQEFVNQLLAGDQIPDQIFYNLLNTAKDIAEMERNWCVLKDKKNYTVIGLNNVLDFPEDAFDFDVYNAVIGIDTEGRKYRLIGAKFTELELLGNDCGKYAIDNKKQKIHLLQNFLNQTTITVNFLGHTPNITADTVWEGFPKNAGQYLAYLVSGLYKGGVDYDDIYARMSPENKTVAEIIRQNLIMWDDRLRRMELGL